MARVVHFEIHGSDLERQIAFYSGLFGWSFTRWGQQDYYLIRTGPDDSPGINGGLILRRGSSPAAGQAVNAFVCTVEVEGLDGLLEKALMLGGTLALPRMAIPGVGWLAYVQDPDGNLLGLTEPDPSAA